MQKTKSKIILFSIGAFGYGLIEILWRGYTHWSMLSAGGICFMFFASMSEKLKRTSLFIKALIGSLFITGIELIFGVIFNVILKKNVWDYSKMPLNFGGQICAFFSFLWLLLSIIFIPVAGYVNKKLK